MAHFIFKSVFLFSIIWICGSCSINFDDPVGDIQDEMVKSVPFTFKVAAGVWTAKSVLLPGQSKFQPITKKVSFEIFRDSTYRISDPEGTIFSYPGQGWLFFRNDTLSFTPVSGKPAQIKKFHVEITFKGSFLRLIDGENRREIKFSRTSENDPDKWTYFIKDKKDSPTGKPEKASGPSGLFRYRRDVKTGVTESFWNNVPIKP